MVWASLSISSQRIGWITLPCQGKCHRAKECWAGGQPHCSIFVDENIDIQRRDFLPLTPLVVVVLNKHLYRAFQSLQSDSTFILFSSDPYNNPAL